jgi:hypothetical protein
VTKPKRFQIPIFSVLSFVLMVTVVVAWIRSSRHAYLLGFFTPAGNLQALASDRSGLLLFFSDVPFGPEFGLSADAMTSSAQEFKGVHEMLFDAANPQWNLIGFHFSTGKIGSHGWKFHCILVPYWAAIIPLAVLPFRGVQGIYLRWLRGRRGLCLACGYDLRHSAERCPECGEPIPPWFAPPLFPRGCVMGLVVTILLQSLLVIPTTLLHARYARAMAASLEPAAPERAAGLAHPIPAMSRAEVSLSEAVHRLQEAGGVPVHLRLLRPRAKYSADSDFSVSMHWSATTLDAALDRIVVQNSLPISYDVMNGHVTIANECELPMVVRLYDMKDLEGPVPSGAAGIYDSGQPANVLAEVLQWNMDLCYCRGTKDCPALVQPACGHLLVVETRQRHRQLGRLLAGLHAATPGGITPALPSFGHSWPDSSDGLRIYDVRDLWATLVQGEEYRTLTRHFADAGITGRGEIVGGRLIFEGDSKEWKVVASYLARLCREKAR